MSRIKCDFAMIAYLVAGWRRGKISRYWCGRSSVRSSDRSNLTQRRLRLITVATVLRRLMLCWPLLDRYTLARNATSNSETLIFFK